MEIHTEDQIHKYEEKGGRERGKNRRGGGEERVITSSVMKAQSGTSIHAKTVGDTAKRMLEIQRVAGKSYF